LKGYFALISYFENTNYININRTFKAKNENKTSLSKTYTYLIRIPKFVWIGQNCWGGKTRNFRNEMHKSGGSSRAGQSKRESKLRTLLNHFFNDRSLAC
jgi:DNA-directed RNA polymerase delta subunit